MSFDKDKFLNGLKDFSSKAGEKISDGAKAGVRIAKENAPKVADMAKKGADKTVKFAKENAPKVKSFAKDVKDELVDAGSQVKDFAKTKYSEHKNRNNIKVYSTKDVINYEDTKDGSSSDTSDIKASQNDDSDN